MVAVRIETEPAFRVLSREPLFEGEYVQYRWSRQYDVHPDGQSFVMIKNPSRGNIEVVTEPGRYSLFRVRLPRWSR